MRKSLVARQVKYFYDLLELELSEKSYGGNTYKVVNNWFPISTALYKLNEYDFVGNSIQDIFDLGASFQSSSKTIAILSGEYNNFLIKFNIVRAKCEAVIDSTNLDDDLQEIYIKLPNNLKDLTNMASIIKDLDLSFNKCPIFSDNIGRITFNRVEEGSSWIVVTIGAVISGSKVLDWIANFIKSCNEIRIQNRTIKSMDLDNILKAMEIEEKEQQQYKDKIIKSDEEKIKEICIEEFKKLNLENDNIKPEDNARIVHCMKTLADLLDAGIEIYPSTSSDEKIKKLFPKQDEFKMIEDTQKLLSDTSEK